MVNEIVAYQVDPQALSLYMPVVDVRMAIERRNMIEAFTKKVMVADRDYGVIPGTGGKDTLLKAGAEKLCSFFGLLPDFVPLETILDFDGAGEGRGEPLIYYRVRCDLYKNGVKVGSGEASCHSRETKYRYRNASRVCPNCGKDTIRKGAPDKGGGWYCWGKIGGCNAKFKDGDKAIESQEVGRVPNPDVADLDNTILKMADKRALVAATLIATNVSDHFTQDMDDFASVGSTIEYHVEEKPKTAPPPPVDLKALTTKIRKLGEELYGDQWAATAKEIAAKMNFTWGNVGAEKLAEVLAHLENQTPTVDLTPVRDTLL